MAAAGEGVAVHAPVETGLRQGGEVLGDAAGAGAHAAVAAPLPVGAVLGFDEFVVVEVPGAAVEVLIRGGHRRGPGAAVRVDGAGGVLVFDLVDAVLVEPVPGLVG